VGESSYWPELLGLFHWAELLYQCKLALSVDVWVRQLPAALLKVGVGLQGRHQQADMLEVCVGV